MTEKSPHSSSVTPADTSEGQEQEGQPLDKPADALSQPEKAIDSSTALDTPPDPSKSLAAALDDALCRIDQISSRLEDLSEQAVTQKQLEALTERLQHLESLVELATAWLPLDSDVAADELRELPDETQ